MNDASLFNDGYYFDGYGKRYYFEYSREITNKCPIFTVDINGLKKTNRMGYDIFMFRPTKDGRIIGMGKEIKQYDTTVLYGSIDSIDNPETYCNFIVSDNHNGFGCAYYAIIDKHQFDVSKT